MKRFWFVAFLVALSALAGCGKDEEKTGKVSSPAPQSLTVPLVNRTLPVRIPFRTMLEPWQKIDVSIPKKAVLIGVMIEEGTAVAKDDLIATALIVSEDREYIPVNIISPIDGMVSHIYYSLNDTISAGARILTVINTDYLSASVKLKPGQMQIVPDNAKVLMFSENDTIPGYVVKKIRVQNTVEIRTGKKDGTREIPQWVNGYIDCGRIKGSFLKKKYFAGFDSLTVLLPGEISFPVRAIGVADSLVLIHPTIPDVAEIKLIGN